MASLERRLKKVEQMSDAVSDYYDCEACLWAGVMAEKGRSVSLTRMIARTTPLLANSTRLSGMDRIASDSA